MPRYHTLGECQWLANNPVCAQGPEPRVGAGFERIDPVHFLARCLNTS